MLRLARFYRSTRRLSTGGWPNLHPRHKEFILHRNNQLMDERDLTVIEKAVKKIGTGPEKVLEMLQAIQAHFGYLPTEALERVCELTKITPASIAGVSTFYNQFRHRPAGRHIIHVCVGTACHVKGSHRILAEFRRP